MERYEERTPQIAATEFTGENIAEVVHLLARAGFDDIAQHFRDLCEPYVTASRLRPTPGGEREGVSVRVRQGDFLVADVRWQSGYGVFDYDIQTLTVVRPHDFKTRYRKSGGETK